MVFVLFIVSFIIICGFISYIVRKERYPCYFSVPGYFMYVSSPMLVYP
jgi:hypothetical protein